MRPEYVRRRLRVNCGLPEPTVQIGTERMAKDRGCPVPAQQKTPGGTGGFMERRGIEPRFAECDSAVIPLDHRPARRGTRTHARAPIVRTREYISRRRMVKRL